MKSDQVGSNIIFRESQKYIDNKISILLIEEEEDIEKRNTRCPQIRIYELSLPFWEGREERDEDHSDKTTPGHDYDLTPTPGERDKDRSDKTAPKSPKGDFKTIRIKTAHFSALSLPVPVPNLFREGGLPLNQDTAGWGHNFPGRYTLSPLPKLKT